MFSPQFFQRLNVQLFQEKGSKVSAQIDAKQGRREMQAREAYDRARTWLIENDEMTEENQRLLDEKFANDLRMIQRMTRSRSWR